MFHRPSARKGIAVVLFLIGIVLPIFYRHWLATRTFIAFDMPVSIAPGHIRTGEFHVNLRGQYFVRLDLDEKLISKPACSPYRVPPLVVTYLMVFRNGQLV